MAQFSAGLLKQIKIKLLFLCICTPMAGCHASTFYFRKRVPFAADDHQTAFTGKPISESMAVLNDSIVQPSIDTIVQQNNFSAQTPVLNKNFTAQQSAIKTNAPEKKPEVKKRINKSSGQDNGRMWLAIFLFILILAAGAFGAYFLGVWIFGTSWHIFIQSVLFLLLMTPVVFLFKMLLLLWGKLLLPKEK